MMEELELTQSATELVGNINSNLQEMGSSAEVTTSMSATSLASTLNTAFGDVSGAETLDLTDNTADFISDLNANFSIASTDEPVIQVEGIGEFDKDTYGTEMDTVVSKVRSLADDADMVFVVSTDLHHEQNEKTTVVKGGVTYNNVPLNYYKYTLNGQVYEGNLSTHTDTLSPMLSNQHEFLRLARKHSINVDAIVSLGDFFDGRRHDYDVDGVTVLTAKDAVTEYVGRITAKFKALSTANNIPLLFAVGNHDDNWDNGQGAINNDMNTGNLTYQDLYDWYLDDTVDPVNKCNDTSGVDYYVDYADANIRVVVLYCDSSAKSNTWCIPKKSFLYLQSCVSSLPSGYKVLILTHTHPYQSDKKYEEIYDESQSANIPVEDAFMAYIEANADKFIGYICGHDHSDYVLGFPIASVALLCNLKTGNWRDSNDVWNVITIDKANELINVVRFGQTGGNWFSDHRRGDVIVHYTPIVKTTGESVTLTPSITVDNEMAWTQRAYSWYKRANATKYQSSNYASISAAQDNSTCTVTVSAQDSQLPQCVCVSCRNADTVEYWIIKIPKQTVS